MLAVTSLNPNQGFAPSKRSVEDFVAKSLVDENRLKFEPKIEEKTGLAKFWDLAKNYAGIIDSRESITRLVLDLTAFDIPVILAGATRNWKSFLEACFEASWSTLALLFAPMMTKAIAKISSNFILKQDEKAHYDKILRFYRNELTDETSFKKGLHRILNEEPRDLERVAKLYSNIKNTHQEQSYMKQANDLREYFSGLRFEEETIKRFNNIKEATIIGESALEGLFWGGFGLVLRWFRKNILKEDRFTGTKEYLNDKDSKKLGQGDELKPFQRFLGRSAMFLSPILNTILLKLSRDKGSVAQNSFLQMVRQGLDMTHGLFPKLGLLFSYTTVPKWFGAFSTTQGSDELIERIIKFFTLMPSWWLGHRVANGSLAAYYDKKLADKYKVSRGILLEPEYVGKLAPDPAKIHHVMEVTEYNPELQREAKDAHAKVLYAGIALHSLGVFGVTMLANQITKWRVQSKQAKLLAA